MNPLKIYLETILEVAEQTDPAVRVDFLELLDGSISVIVARKVTDKIVAKCSTNIEEDKLYNLSVDRIKSLAKSGFEFALKGVDRVEQEVIKGEYKPTLN